MDTNELKVGQIIINAGKIGVVDDIFRNEKGEAWIVFSSAETIVRNPFDNKTNEFIPFVPYATRLATLDDFIGDIDNKIKSTKENLQARIDNGLKMFTTIIGGVRFVQNGDEPYLLLFSDEKQVLVESVLGEKKLAYHPRLFHQISRKDAVEMAERRYRKLVDNTIARLMEFENSITRRGDYNLWTQTEVKSN